MNPRAITVPFLLLLFGVPLGQAAWELARSERPAALEVFGPIEEARLRRFEDELRQSSFVHRQVTPWYQAFLTAALRRGNEKALIGRSDWLYYSEDLDYVHAPDFLAGRTWSPADAVADFRDQLADLGAELLVVPVPPKVTVEPSFLASWTADVAWPDNPAAAAFHGELRARGVQVVELGPLYRELRAAAPDSPLYLARDTHWSPATMRAVAARVAREARAAGVAPEPDPGRWEAVPRSATGPGDLVGMLRLPAGVEPFPPLAVEFEAVRDARTGAPFAPERDAEVLLLGDSFTRVFSDPQLGLGKGAGLAESLAHELGSPLDVIAISGGGARAVREALARRPGGPAGKRLVIWQFSMRDLAADPERWERVALRAPDGDAAPGAAGRVSVEAEVVEVSRVPSEFDYAFCLAVYEYRVLALLEGPDPGAAVWVAHVAVDDYAEEPGAAFAAGERHRLVLEDVGAHHDLEATSWVDDTDAGAAIWFPVEWAPAE